MWTERAIVYIDPNCHKNLVDMYCERLDNPALVKYLYNNTLDESWSVSMKLAASFSSPTSDTACKKLNKHNQCLQTQFRPKCEHTMALAFIKIDKFVQQCAAVLAKMKKQSSTGSPATLRVQSITSFLLVEFSVILWGLIRF